MYKKYKTPLISVICAGVALLIAGAVFTLKDRTFAVLQPKGTVAAQELRLMIIASLLAVLIVVPVFTLAFIIVWRYREGAKKPGKYTPDVDHNRVAETIWWVVPLVLILILSGITWTSSHDLDPYRALQSKNQPLHIQVVALQWKWLFIYPQQQIATVNYVQFPADTPVTFEITSDAPMNSFWIPQLGGQIYAMSGMTTNLHLMADKPGTYRGSSANISGKGFAGMRFTAESTPLQDFDQWVWHARSGSQYLNNTTYAKLAQPSENHSITTYASADTRLYGTIMQKYMGHGMHSSGHNHEGTE